MLKVLKVMDLDYALRVEKPVAPDFGDENIIISLRSTLPTLISGRDPTGWHI